MEYLFVYGTLRRGASSDLNKLLSSHCSFYSSGYITAKLYEVDGYPGAAPSNNSDDRVYGEIYEIRDKALLLPLLDEYEECSGNFPEPQEYIRTTVNATTKNGDCLTAWIYLYNRPTTALEQIVSGDYCSYLKS